MKTGGKNSEGGEKRQKTAKNAGKTAKNCEKMAKIILGATYKFFFCPGYRTAAQLYEVNQP